MSGGLDTTSEQEITMSVKESKRETFVRLAEYRVNRLLKNIDQLGNLSNTQSYEADSDDFNAIITTLMTAVRDCQSRFEKGKPEVTAWTLD